MQNSSDIRKKSLKEVNLDLTKFEEEEKEKEREKNISSTTRTRTYRPALNENREYLINAPEEDSSPDAGRKVKSSRSRFSSAFRSFRGSSSSGSGGSKTADKKKIPELAAISAAVVAEAVISSGGDEDQLEPLLKSSHQSTSDIGKKKKSKLAKRFSLSGIKRHKINPKLGEESIVSSTELISSGTQTTKSLDRRQIDNLSLDYGKNSISSVEPLTPSSISLAEQSYTSSISGTATPPESPHKYEKIRKIQITIQGKKIEHTQPQQHNNNGNGGGGGGGVGDDNGKKRRNLPITTTVISHTVSKPDEDYLSAISPLSTTTEHDDTLTNVAHTSSKRNQKKKLKLKKIGNNNNNNNNNTSTTRASVSPPPSVEEKTFVITHSIRDTPPRERAPAKPSRIPATTPVTISYSGTIKKSSIPTLANLTAPLTVAAAAAQPIHHNIRLKRQRSRGESIDSELSFMQREGTIDRGRRFPRPTLSIEPSIGGVGSREEEHSTNNPISPPLPPIIPNQQRRIQFQLHSHEHLQQLSSQSLPSSPLLLPSSSQPTSLPSTFISVIPNRQQQEQQQLSNQQISSSLTGIATAGAEVEVEEEEEEEVQQQQHTSLPIQLIAPLTVVSNSGPSETISLDSHRHQQHQQQLSLENNIKDLSITRKFSSAISSLRSNASKEVISQESNEYENYENHNDGDTVNRDRARGVSFAVGTAVRQQTLSSERTISITDTREFSSIGSSIRSSDSRSPVSDSSAHQHRIHYVRQPTLYTEEEREIIEGRRSNYLSGISEYSFDSDEESDETQMPAFGDLTMDQEEPPIMTTTGEKREHLYKILVIGELGTGKTSFIKRYVHQFFSQNYRATIGVDFALKVLHWDPNTIVRLQLWDIAGQERFGNMTRVYYKEAVGAFIVFDVTRSGTFDCVSKWKEDLDSKVQLPDGSPIPCILLANKCDQDKQGIVTTPEKMDEYIRDNGFAGWYETSAKENINIDEAARALVNKILLNDKLISAADLADSERFSLNTSGNSQSTAQSIKNKCSC